jgi:hypothetical protein
MQDGQHEIRDCVILNGKGKPMSVEYFADFDGYPIYASIEYGSKGIFRLGRDDAKWEFVQPGSPHWDDIHQTLYWSRKVDNLTAVQIAALPPLPPIPEYKRLSWRDYFLPAHPLNVSDYPNLAGMLKAQVNPAVTVSVLLHEDRYETMLGDGEFHYLHSVFLEEPEAITYSLEHKEEWSEYHLRKITFSLQENHIEFSDFNPERFDHFSVEEVLAMLEKALEKKEKSLFRGV